MLLGDNLYETLCFLTRDKLMASPCEVNCAWRNFVAKYFAARPPFSLWHEVMYEYIGGHRRVLDSLDVTQIPWSVNIQQRAERLVGGGVRGYFTHLMTRAQTPAALNARRVTAKTNWPQHSQVYIVLEARKHHIAKLGDCFDALMHNMGETLADAQICNIYISGVHWSALAAKSSFIHFSRCYSLEINQTDNKNLGCSLSNAKFWRFFRLEDFRRCVHLRIYTETPLPAAEIAAFLLCGWNRCETFTHSATQCTNHAICQNFDENYSKLRSILQREFPKVSEAICCEKESITFSYSTSLTPDWSYTNPTTNEVLTASRDCLGTLLLKISSKSAVSSTGRS